MSNNCPLCSKQSFFFCKVKDKTYNKCSNCDAIILLPEFILSAEKEKEHYSKHNNDVFDVNYQKFVSPISTFILNNRGTKDIGLDFGAGTGPVISKVLKDNGFTIKQYDPFFHNDNRLLNSTYDYIACCEVMEHFHDPYKEFRLLRKLLNNNGDLLCMTEIYNQDIDFANWYYKNDPTHVFIFQKRTLEWICKEFKFKNLYIHKRFIHLSV